MGKIAELIRGCSIPEQKRHKLLTLDEKFSALVEEIEFLKAENRQLEIEINPLKREVETLKQRVKAQDSATLDDTSEKLLQAIGILGP